MKGFALASTERATGWRRPLPGRHAALASGLGCRRNYSYFARRYRFFVD